MHGDVGRLAGRLERGAHGRGGSAVGQVRENGHLERGLHAGGREGSRIAAQLGRRAMPGHATAREQHDVVYHAEPLAHVMADDDGGRPSRGQAANHGVQLVATLGIEAVRRFVEHIRAGSHGHDASKCHASPLSARKGKGRASPKHLVHAKAPQGLPGARIRLVRGGTKVARAKGHVVKHGVAEQLVLGSLLTETHHAGPNGRVAQPCLAGVGFQHARKHARKRRLARSGPSGDEQHAAGRGSHSRAVECGRALVTDCHVASDQRGGMGRDLAYRLRRLTETPATESLTRLTSEAIILDSANEPTRIQRRPEQESVSRQTA